MIGLRFSGMRAWQKHLRRSAKKFRQEKRERLKRATAPIKRDAERNIASNFTRRTGRLSRGVKVRLWVKRDRDGATIFMRIPGRAKSGGRAYYGHFLEFGTKHIRPRPFLEPAVKSNEANTFKELGRSFKVL